MLALQSKTANGIEGHEKEIISEAERLDVKDKAALVLAEIFFTENMLAEIVKYRKLFLRVCLMEFVQKLLYLLTES